MNFEETFLIRRNIIISILLILLLTACGTPAATETVTVTPSQEPTQTPTQTPAPTDTPVPTPLPGKLVLPLDTLGLSNPWLPYDESVIPAVSYFGFNTQKPPFNSALVRQAFAAAIDRQVVMNLYTKYGSKGLQPSTTLTPPEVMGRDLYGEVGITFDPEKAKALLAEAGYQDPSGFPEVTFIVNLAGDAAPGAHQNVAEAVAKMWKDYLGVTVKVETLNWNAYRERLASNPPEIFRIGWVADYNDPQNFLGDIFEQINYGGYDNSEYFNLVNEANDTKLPAIRQKLYLQAEQILCETDAAVVPLYHYTYKP